MFGGEADFDNRFSFGAHLLFDHFARSGSVIPAPRLAPGHILWLRSLASACWRFAYDINGPPNQLYDSSNLDDSGHSLVAPNFFVSCNPFGGSPATTCDRLWIFLDDSGGGNPTLTTTTWCCG